MVKTTPNDHEQPLNRLYNRKRINDRTIDELIGMAKGITADNLINQAEAEFLLNWMNKNTAYSEDRVVNMLYSRLRDMLCDNVLDKKEQKELLDILKSISGEQGPADIVNSTAASFPLDKPPPPIEFDNAAFCLTGKFAYGPRRICTAAIAERGGIIKSGVSRLVDYLVIGSLCSTDWIHTSYGRKIEAAMKIQDDSPKSSGYPSIAIIHEDHWAEYAFRG